jgi:hypothetical protein
MNKIAVTLAVALTAFAACAAEKKEPTTQQQLMTTCNFEAKNRELKGEDRRKFMSGCLSSGSKRQQEVMKSCNVEARSKKGDDRRKFMAECLRK